MMMTMIDWLIVKRRTLTSIRSLNLLPI